MWFPGWSRGSRGSQTAAFGYAIVGTGHGAKKLADALRSSTHARVTAIVSSTVEKAERFGRRYGVSRAYSYADFDAIAGDSAVDAVYLPLPVGLHREFTERAAAAGKHVLCEKPMAASVADARAMIEACAQASRLLMIAYRLDYDPMHAEARRLLEAGELGRVKHVRSAFGIVAKEGWRFDAALAGGGSLFDVGVYPMHALRNFFGDVRVESAEIAERGGMEVDAAWRGLLPGGATFECRSSYIERVPDALTIECERGELQLSHAFAYERTQMRARWTDAAGRPHTLKRSDARRNPSLFRLEAEHLAECVRRGQPLRSPGASGLADLETIARIEAMARRRSV